MFYVSFPGGYAGFWFIWEGRFTLRMGVAHKTLFRSLPWLAEEGRYSRASGAAGAGEERRVFETWYVFQRKI